MKYQRARRRFGQHFLVDPGVVDAIVDAVSPQPDDTLVEIGPGRGAITGPLAARSRRLVAIELDRDLAASLKNRFGDSAGVVVEQADALAIDYSRFGRSLRIVGNLPYNISTPLLFRLLEFSDAIRDMHFMLQKEVVDRIAAVPGTRAYGRLGIMLSVHFDAERLFDVPPQAFDPPPAVTSSVVRLLPNERRRDVADRDALSRLLAAAFSRRRKTLRNALKPLAASPDFAALGIDERLRPEDLPVDAWVQLANRLAAPDRLPPQ